MRFVFLPGISPPLPVVPTLSVFPDNLSLLPEVYADLSCMANFSTSAHCSLEWELGGPTIRLTTPVGTVAICNR